MADVNFAFDNHNSEMSMGHHFSCASSRIALSVDITQVMSAFSVLALSICSMVKERFTLYRNVLMIRHSEIRII